MEDGRKNAFLYRIIALLNQILYPIKEILYVKSKFTIRRTIFRTNERMKEAYQMLGSCASVKDISAPGEHLSHIFKDTIEAMLKAEMISQLAIHFEDRVPIDLQ